MSQIYILAAQKFVKICELNTLFIYLQMVSVILSTRGVTFIIMMLELNRNFLVAQFSDAASF